jgi:hypothetical protein
VTDLRNEKNTNGKVDIYQIAGTMPSEKRIKTYLILIHTLPIVMTYAKTQRIQDEKIQEH